MIDWNLVATLLVAGVLYQVVAFVGGTVFALFALLLAAIWRLR